MSMSDISAYRLDGDRFVLPPTPLIRAAMPAMLCAAPLPDLGRVLAELLFSQQRSSTSVPWQWIVRGGELLGLLSRPRIPPTADGPP